LDNLAPTTLFHTNHSQISSKEIDLHSEYFFKLANSIERIKEGLPRLGLFVLFLISGLLIFFFGSSYFSLFPTNQSDAYRFAVMVVFLVAALLLRRSASIQKYWLIAYAFFIAALAQFLASSLVTIREWLFGSFQIAPNDMIAGKLFEAFVVITTIILLTKVVGGSLGSIYFQKGNMKVGLFVGLCMLLNNLAIGFIMGINNGLTPEALLSIMPRGLTWALTNALMEELWFRGLFLRKLVPFIGISGSILVTSVTFTLTHAGAVYINPEQVPFFLATLFPLALLWAYLMHKTDSVWGSMLFHAGADMFLFLAMGLGQT
jgi:membrane protease YdiL (CAAX protease family)